MSGTSSDGSAETPERTDISTRRSERARKFVFNFGLDGYASVLLARQGCAYCGGEWHPPTLCDPDGEVGWRIYERGTVEEAKAFLHAHGIGIDRGIDRSQVELPVGEELGPDWEEEFVFDVLYTYLMEGLLPDRDAAWDIEDICTSIPEQFEIFEPELDRRGRPVIDTNTGELVSRVVGTRDGMRARFRELTFRIGTVADTFTDGYGNRVQVIMPASGETTTEYLEIRNPEAAEAEKAWDAWWKGLTAEERDAWHRDPDAMQALVPASQGSPEERAAFAENTATHIGQPLSTSRAATSSLRSSPPTSRRIFG